MQHINLLEVLIQEYGEKYRSLFVDSIKWLEENEQKWKLEVPINKEVFLRELVEQIRISL